MRLADTNLDAFASLLDSGAIGRQQAQILIHLRTTGASLTRNEIAAQTGIRLSAVCGRVRELLDAGKLEELPRRACTLSGIGAHPVRIAV
jgi:predicted transcriptional regulator